MREPDWDARIAARIGRSGLQANAAVVAQLAVYLELLGRWNRRLNLTGLAVDPLEDQAIDRLVIESLEAARYVRLFDQLSIDIGSGGGSPAIPLKIACPWLAFVLVESKARKCAFLREVVRELGLADVQVEHCRFEDLPTMRPELAGRCDLVSFRAVRADAVLWRIAAWLLKPDGRVVWFGGAAAGLPEGFQAEPFASGVLGSLLVSSM